MTTEVPDHVKLLKENVLHLEEANAELKMAVHMAQVTLHEQDLGLAELQHQLKIEKNAHVLTKQKFRREQKRVARILQEMSKKMATIYGDED